MAKPTKHAPLINTTVTIIAAIGIIVGLLIKSPLLMIILLLPAVIYEVYRTEGVSTKASSALLLVLLIAEILLIVFNISFNLAEFLGVGQKYIGGYLVPLGDIKVVGPILMAVLSVILFVKTYGIYTKWLAVVIFITSFAIIYAIDPNVFSDLLRYAVGEGLDRVGY